MISSTTWTLCQQFVLVAALLLLNCDASPYRHACLQVISENQTVENDEISTGIGSDVTLDCIHPSGQNGSVDKLFWTNGKSKISSNMVEEVDSNTLRLNLKNATSSQSGYYRCINDSPQGNGGRGICLTNILIGYKPLPVVDFSCTSYNWEYMVCSWTSPDNPVKVDYILSLVYNRQMNMLSNPVTPLRKKGRSGIYYYNFTSSSIPQYQMHDKIFNFTLYGKNKLGNSTWNFTIDHFARVIPGKVEDLQASSIADDPRNYNITYRRSLAMKYYDSPGLLYRVHFKSQWNDTKSVVESNETWTQLPHLDPFTEYDLNVTCLSKMANKSMESMWSQPATIKFKTLTAVPGEPPKIVPGSFRLQSFINHTDITLYWKATPDRFKHGQHFKYIIKAESLTTKAVTSLSTEQGDVTFRNLSHTDSYRFELSSENDVGTSNSSSSIVVGAANSLLPKPASITVIAYSPVNYTVKWLPPSNMSLVTGYRIFWLESHSTFQVNPNGFLFWKDVDNSVKETAIRVSGRWPYRHFGVTTIGEDNSASGIIWNTCIVLHNGTISKMKKVSASPHSSSSLNVLWNIDCAEKLGIITGFKVYYCIIENETDEHCKDAPLQALESDENAVSTVVENLKAYTWYRVTVAVVTEAGEGEQSSVIVARTLESVPETAASDVALVEATNSSFVVKWHPPNVTNGVITEYKIIYVTETEQDEVKYPMSSALQQGTESTYQRNVTEKVASYTNYTVTLLACTSVGCSPPSPPKTILTAIGVPKQMDPPQVRLVNQTYAVVHPEMSGGYNGPSPTWEIDALIITVNNDTKNFSYVNLTEKMKYIPINCEDPQLSGATMKLKTRAANHKNTEVLFGDWSDYAKINCISPTFPFGFIIAIVIGSAIGLTIMILFTIIVTRKVKVIVQKCRTVKIDLPIGMNPEGYEGFVAGHRPNHRINDYTKADYKNGTSKKLLEDDPRTRNISGDTTQSSGSTEELLMQSKGPRMNWGHDSIGSGNHDSISSRASTTQTQLSSESSSDLLPSVPESPDSVFTIDHPLKVANAISTIAPPGDVANNTSMNGFNPTLAPIGESQDGSSSQSGTPQHYSKFAGYYAPANDSASPKRGRGGQNGYVAAPYSKFGVGMMGGSSNTGGIARAESPTDPFSLEIGDNDSLPLSYSKVGLSIPLFGEQPQQQPPNPFEKAISTASSPLTSTPTHAVTGYSVLGLGQGNPSCENSVGPFYQPPPVAVSSPLEGSSKGYVLAAAMNNLAVPPQIETPVISAQQNCESSLPTQIEGIDSPNYINMNAHKRSPSNASSLTAGYCRLALSRPTSMCSESDPNYVRSDSQTDGATMVGSPIMSSCHNGAIDMVSSGGSPSHNGGGNNIVCNPVNSGSATGMTVVGSSGPSGYATMQQLLKEKGNS